MNPLTDEFRDFLDAQRVGVLATIARDGTARQSVVYFASDGGRLLISTLADRLKAGDVRRTGWASLCVMGHEPPYPSARFSDPAAILSGNIGDATATIMRRITGVASPPDAIDDDALGELGRVILAIDVARVTAANYIGPTA